MKLTRANTNLVFFFKFILAKLGIWPSHASSVIFFLVFNYGVISNMLISFIIHFVIKCFCSHDSLIIWVRHRGFMSARLLQDTSNGLMKLNPNIWFRKTMWSEWWHMIYSLVASLNHKLQNQPKLNDWV